MTKFVGILNLTPDSFFDGGKYVSEQEALEQLENLLQSGFDIIDIGAESTRPGAISLNANEEWLRLKDILPKVIKIVKNFNQNNNKKVLISLDSRHYQNVAYALEIGVDIINDVSGFSENSMINLAVKSKKKIILMHNLGIPADKNKIVDENQDIIKVLINWVKAKLEILEKSGVKREQIIFDPGIGFGKNAAQSIKIIKEIDQLKTLDLPLYIGHSNKSFLDEWQIENSHSRIDKTNFVTNYLTAKNIDYIRLHSK